jgi:hypothetical protein
MCSSNIVVWPPLQGPSTHEHNSWHTIERPCVSTQKGLGTGLTTPFLMLSNFVLERLQKKEA